MGFLGEWGVVLEVYVEILHARSAFRDDTYMDLEGVPRSFGRAA